MHTVQCARQQKKKAEEDALKPQIEEIKEQTIPTPKVVEQPIELPKPV